MTRQEKYPETKSFWYLNVNPKNRMTGDCWLRAVSRGLDQNYNDVLMEMVKVHLETGYEMSCDKAVETYLKSKGWYKRKQPRRLNGTKYTGEEFCNWLSMRYPKGEAGRVIANIGGHHMVAIEPTYHGDGINCRYKCRDTWNCTRKCIGNYYTELELELEY